MRTTQRHAWQAAIVLVLLLLAGCANLQAVREFGRAAADVTSLPDAGKAYEESARTLQPYLVGAAAPANTPERREAQVRAAVAVQSSLSAYFATLAKLAGDDAFALDKQVDAIGQGLQALPADAIDPATAQAATGLARTLQKYVLLRAQESAVRDLVQEGGPPAMRILDRLSVVIASWKGTVANDRATVVGTLDPLTQAKDTPPLLAMLGRDRKAELEHAYAASIQRIAAAETSFAKIRTAHALMEQNLDQLRGEPLRALLKQAVADLKDVRKDLQALNQEATRGRY